MAKIERQKRIYRKRIPYGMQNFEDVMERPWYDNYCFDNSIRVKDRNQTPSL